MFEKIKEKIVLLKRKKCLEALNFVLDSENIYNYNVSKGLINYHSSFLSFDNFNDPLIIIRRFYCVDLIECESKLKKASRKEMKMLLERIKYDNTLIDELSEELVNNYNSRFEKYKGNITGAQLKTLKLTVESNNDSADTDNTIKMYIDNIETNENTNVDTNSNYSVQMEYGSNGFINKIVANKI